MVSGPIYYKHSGHIGFLGPPFMAVVGFPLAVALGAIYGYLIWYNPFIYINFLATMACGGLCGVAVGWAAKSTKVRNGWFVALFGLAVGLFSLYSGWVAWIHALSEQSYFSPTSPQEMFLLIDAIAEDGAWSVFDWTPTGGALYTIWTIEAIMIVGSAVIGSSILVDASENTFCDNCNEWAEDVYTSPLLADIEESTEFKLQLERAEYQPLLDMAHADATEAPGDYTRLVVQGCKKCWNFFCLDVKRVALSKDDEGKLKEKETLLLDNLLIDANLYETIKERVGHASAATPSTPIDQAGSP